MEQFKMQEDMGTIRKIKKIMSSAPTDGKELTINDRLFTGEYVGDFAIRYVAYLLHKRAEKLKQRKFKKARLLDVD